MKLTKREITYIQGYFGNIERIMKEPETRKNLITYGIFCGRFMEIVYRRIKWDEPGEIKCAENYIKNTLGNNFWQWYIKEHEQFLNKEKQSE